MIYTMTSKYNVFNGLVMSLVWIAPTQFVVFESEPGGGSRRKGRPRQRWAKLVTENVTTLVIRNWRQAAIARDTRTHLATP